MIKIDKLVIVVIYRRIYLTKANASQNLDGILKQLLVTTQITKIHIANFYIKF